MKERAIICYMDCVSVPSATLGLNTSVTRYLAVYSKVNFPNITEMYRRVDFKFCLKQNKLSKNGYIHNFPKNWRKFAQALTKCSHESIGILLIVQFNITKLQTRKCLNSKMPKHLNYKAPKHKTV